MLDLDRLRHVGDPALDPHAAALLPCVPALGAAFGALRNGDALPAALPHRALFAPIDLPAWMDPARIDRAAAFFGRHGLPFALLLGTASLVECYAMGGGVAALHRARRMRDDTRRRVGETARFVLQVFARGAFGPGGVTRGVLLKVRLQHAVARLHVGRAGWDVANGVPLCQEDQLGTLLAFGYSPIVHLRALGVPISAAEAEDMLHLWAVVGHVLGVDAAGVPATDAAADGLRTTIIRRHARATPEGRELAATLLRTYARTTRVPGADRALGEVLRGLVGDTIADAVDLPRSPLVSRLPPRRLGLRTWGRVRTRVPMGSAEAQRALMGWRAEWLARG